MQTALYAAATLLVLVGVAHSFLGERYILIRLFRRSDLPAILGSATFTKRTLRFAWHITTLAWWGLAAILILMAHPPLRAQTVGLVIGWTFLLHAAVSLIGSRGRHLSWIAFLAIGALTLYATHS